MKHNTTTRKTKQNFSNYSQYDNYFDSTFSFESAWWSNATVSDIEKELAEGKSLKRRDSLATTPLMYASAYSSIDVIKHLLKKGMKRNSKDYGQWTAHRWAQHYQRPNEILELLKV